MIKLRALFFAVIIALLPIFVYANAMEGAIEDSIVMQSHAKHCYATPEVWGLHPIVSGHTNNRLIRKRDSEDFAIGQYIMLYGRVLDQQCVPITGAKVEIIQADHAGNYPWDSAVDHNFAGSGVSITDNLGRYAFYTVMPGAKSGTVPTILLSVKHTDFSQIETAVFFHEKDAEKFFQKKSKAYIHLIAQSTGLENEKKLETYKFDVTLNNVLSYKHY